MANEIHFRLAAGAHARRGRRGHLESFQGSHALRQPLLRVTRLMALAIRFEALLCELPELSYTDLARLSGVCRSRIAQILNLLYLAPDLQERLLFWPSTPGGRDQIHEPGLRKLCQIDDWEQQRVQFEAMFGDSRPDKPGSD